MSTHGRVRLYCAACGHLVAEVHPPVPPVPTRCVGCSHRVVAADDHEVTIAAVASHDAPGAPIRVDVSRFRIGPDEIEFGLSLHGSTTDVWTLDTARAALDAIAAAVDAAVDTLEREMNAHN